VVSCCLDFINLFHPRREVQVLKAYEGRPRLMKGKPSMYLHQYPNMSRWLVYRRWLSCL
jgi:hypothetical protein